MTGTVLQSEAPDKWNPQNSRTGNSIFGAHSLWRTLHTRHWAFVLVMMKGRMDNTGTLSIWSTSRIPTHPILRMPNAVYSLYHIMLALESQYFNSLEIFYEHLPVYFLIGSCWSFCKSNVLKILHMGFPSPENFEPLSTVPKWWWHLNSFGFTALFEVSSFGLERSVFCG